MTLRKLYWAQLGRRRDEWERTANILSTLFLTGFKPIWVDPRQLNPLYEAPPESEETRAVRTQMAFDTLEAGLRLMVERQTGGQ